tara:strand:+ start:127 stop:924 length:798 start_codon:yes stop_codon:yes gene_type:complete
MEEINLVDSHCHLIFENFKDDLDEVSHRWKSKGVKKLVHACVEFSDIPKIQAMANRFEEIYYSVGLHPLDANQWNTNSKSLLYEAIKNDKRIVAIGEMGLDLFKNNNLEEQVEALLPQMEIAFECNLPVIIHCRDAAKEMISICKDLKKRNICPKGVLHCWSGTIDEMKEFLDLGFFISFSGIVTFPKAIETHQCAKFVPNDRYLIETDSPFLAPVPYRGKRNEPSFVESVAKSIASIRSSELEVIAKETSENAEKLFRFSLVND